MRGKNFNLVYKCWRKNIDIRKITPSLFLLTGEVSAFCRRGEVNHFPAFLVHFPAENVDFTAISPFFPGKVNHIAANLVHFPPEPGAPGTGCGHFPPELGVAFSDNRSQSRIIAIFAANHYFLSFFFTFTRKTHVFLHTDF